MSSLLRPAALTHDGQGSGLAQLAPHGIDDLQPTPIQVAAVDGMVPGADPVEFAFREVNSQAWKRGSHCWGVWPRAGDPGKGAEDVCESVWLCVGGGEGAGGENRH